MEGCFAEYGKRLPVRVVTREPPGVRLRSRDAPAVGNAVVVANGASIGAAGIRIVVIGAGIKGGAQKLRMRPGPVIKTLRVAVTALVGRESVEIPLFVAILIKRTDNPIDLVTGIRKAEFLRKVCVFLVVGQVTDRIVVPVIGTCRLEAVDVVGRRKIVAERTEIRRVLCGVLRVLGIACEISRRRRETQVIGEIAINRQRILSPVILERVSVKCDELEIPNCRVVGVLSVGLCALDRETERCTPVVSDKPLGRSATARDAGFVPVILGGVRIPLFGKAAEIARISCGTFAVDFTGSGGAGYVVDEAAFGCTEADKSNRKLVISQRHVEHAREVEAAGAFRHSLNSCIRKCFEFCRVGLVGDDTQRARLRTRAKQRALWSAQHFDALNVNEPRVYGGTLCDRLLIEVYG